MSYPVPLRATPLYSIRRRSRGFALPPAPGRSGPFRDARSRTAHAISPSHGGADLRLPFSQQEQLAGLMFLERRTVHRIERGTRTLTLDRAVQIAQALDVPLWRLFRDEDPPGG